MESGTRNYGGKLAAQLMVGPEQLKRFGEAGILASLDYALDTLKPEELILSIGEASRDLARTIVRHCDGRGVRVSLWVMVFADRAAILRPLPYVRDASGNEGYGSIGVWEDIGKGDEKFLFHCPSALGEDGEGIRYAIRSAKAIGARGLFLDRIRYPSPANGLEFLGACSCPRCKEAYRRWGGGAWPDLASMAVHYAAGGERGVYGFVEEAGPAFQFRSEMVAAVVARYAEAAHAGDLRVGLDLFAPSLAALVGQDYFSLSGHADFMKPMLYCKALAPAGLPLEFFLLMRGLEQSGIDARKARDFVSGLSGIDSDALDAVRSKGGFPASLAASELARGRRETDPHARRRPEIYAGIELVEHEAYATKIGQRERDRYLESLSGQNVAVCWNILYVPKEHIDAVASRRKDQ